ncbi:hypothetical protein ACFIJ5_05950 [Haloimpatiens sp. FM7330]|uniref:hypothetical protein n=1 Tax=Haloimpatiens sp. FM7330 TaxID=3298610 RepID=UPI003640B037
MIKFKKMWEDVSSILNNDEFNDNNMTIVESYKDGFIVKYEGKNSFVNKDDFVDFWCKMLYFNEISKEDILKDNNVNQRYVYEVVGKLPYINEESNMLKLME